MHIINPPTGLLIHQPPITIYIAESNEDTLTPSEDNNDANSVIDDIAKESDTPPLNIDMDYLMVP